MTQAGERERVVPVGVSEMFLCKNTFQLKENFVVARRICFPTIPPFSAQERDFKPLTTAIEDRTVMVLSVALCTFLVV